MKRKLISTVIGTFFMSWLMAQDGSNIRYYNPNDLDNSFIGKYCHIDFGKESFRGQVIDTIKIDVNGQQTKFYEHREDNGFNNWFNKQYLIRVEEKNNLSTHLKNSKIDSITSDRIYVTSFLSYYINKSPIDTITVFQHWYDKKNISKVLIKDR